MNSAEGQSGETDVSNYAESCHTFFASFLIRLLRSPPSVPFSLSLLAPLSLAHEPCLSAHRSTHILSQAQVVIFHSSGHGCLRKNSSHHADVRPEMQLAEQLAQLFYTLTCQNVTSHLSQDSATWSHNKVVLKRRRSHCALFPLLKWKKKCVVCHRKKWNRNVFPAPPILVRYYVVLIQISVWPLCPQYIPEDLFTKWKASHADGFTQRSAWSSKWQWKNVISSA